MQAHNRKAPPLAAKTFHQSKARARTLQDVVSPLPPSITGEQEPRGMATRSTTYIRIPIVTSPHLTYGASTLAPRQADIGVTMTTASVTYHEGIQ
jgi:hypothetical protein